MNKYKHLVKCLAKIVKKWSPEKSVSPLLHPYIQSVLPQRFHLPSLRKSPHFLSTFTAMWSRYSSPLIWASVLPVRLHTPFLLPPHPNSFSTLHGKMISQNIWIAHVAPCFLPLTVFFCHIVLLVLQDPAWPPPWPHLLLPCTVPT